MPSRRCMDCPLDATHTLVWNVTDGTWQRKASLEQAALHLYCASHATLRVKRRNARGVLPPMQQLRKLLGTSEKERAHDQ